MHLAGVFVNATLEEIDITVQACGLSLVQLHGDEGPAFCNEVARRTGAKTIKASRVRSKATLQAAAAFHTDFHLLDAHVAGLYGGTGQTVDWDLVRRHNFSSPILLSGGLNPEQRRAPRSRRRSRSRSTSRAAPSARPGSRTTTS